MRQVRCTGHKFKAVLTAHAKMLNIIPAIGKIQIKITVRFHSTSTGMARIKKIITTVGKDVETLKLETYTHY